MLLLALCLISPVILNACASTSNSESTGQYLDSTAITTKVKAELASHLGVSTLRAITVTTYKGVVQLSGFVKDKATIKEAVKVSSKVSGVKMVENSLLVKSKTP